MLLWGSKFPNMWSLRETEVARGGETDENCTDLKKTYYIHNPRKRKWKIALPWGKVNDCIVYSFLLSSVLALRSCWLFILKLLPYKLLCNKDQWATELVIKGSLILNITHVWTREFLSIGLDLIDNKDTVEPWYNEVLLGVTYNFIYPNNSTIYGKESWYDKTFVIANILC